MDTPDISACSLRDRVSELESVLGDKMLLRRSKDLFGQDAVYAYEAISALANETQESISSQPEEARDELYRALNGFLATYFEEAKAMLRVDAEPKDVIEHLYEADRERKAWAYALLKSMNVFSKAFRDMATVSEDSKNVLQDAVFHELEAKATSGLKCMYQGYSDYVVGLRDASREKANKSIERYLGMQSTESHLQEAATNHVIQSAVMLQLNEKTI